MKRALLCTAAMAIAGASVIHSQAAVNVPIDAASGRHAIDPRIYGVAYADGPSLVDLRAPLNRWGGNAATRHNWQANASNRASDWFFESIADGTATPGASADTFVNTAKSSGAEPIITIPTIGWVAKVGASRNNLSSFSVAKYGAQTGADTQFFADAGNGISSPTGHPITGNDPNDANVMSDPAFQKAWVQHLVSRWGSASTTTGVHYYAIDNEPSIWHSTHRDVHPNGASMDEVYNDIVNYGSEVKAADAAALVMGPEEWGWSGYFYSGKDQQWGGANGWASLPDRTAHGNADYLPWVLSQLRQHDAVSGGRLLDVLTVHFYPQGGQYGNDTSVTMQQLRNRSTRSLWDPHYVDESWIATPVQLIPRLKGWVAANYPGTKVGITEYNWGAEAHINGATTEADILGIFGREGLDVATFWTVPASTSPTYKAFKLYRNYDGRGSRFGDVGVSATTPNPDALSVFAAQRATDNALTIMAVNKDLSVSPTVNFSLANFTAGGTAQAWQLTSANAITRLSDRTISGGILSAALPAQSVTLFVVPQQAGMILAPSSPTNVRFLSGAAASISVRSGAPQNGAISTAFGQPLRAIVLDAKGVPVFGQTVTFTAPAGTGASGRFAAGAAVTAVTDGSGVATAPTFTANAILGDYVVSAVVPGVSGAAAFTLTNTPPPSAGLAVNMNWDNVTPAGISLSPDSPTGGVQNNFALQGIHADLGHPGTLYASVTYQGLWKSVDYGLTWAHVDVSGSSPADNGRANIRVAPDGSYILATSLYPVGGVSNGAWKSLDGGRSWTRYTVGAANGDDLNSFEINPNDKMHVLASPHSPPYDLFESRDGGQTWADRGPMGNTANAALAWVDDSTVLAISDGDNGPGPGTWRGVESGTTWSWTKVSSQQHWHGASQSFVDQATGTVFIGGGFGIQKSTDKGLTWTTVSTGFSGGIVATPSTLYSMADYATHGSFGPWGMHSSRANGGTIWINDIVPAALNNGWLYAAVVFDGTHYVIVSGNWNAGIWRHVEE